MKMKEYIKPELKYIIYNGGIMEDEELGSIPEGEEGEDLSNQASFDENEVPVSKSVWD